MRLTIRLLLLGLFSLVWNNKILIAQPIIPLGGNIIAYYQGGSSILFSVKVLLSKGSAIPDSGYFHFFGSIDKGYYPLQNFFITPDSNVIAEYQALINQYNSLRLDFKFFDNDILVGDSGSLINFYLHYRSFGEYPLLEGRLEPFLGTIYHKPTEVVRGNPFIAYYGKDSLTNSNAYFIYTKTIVEQDQSINLQIGTGDFIYFCDTCNSHSSVFYYYFNDLIGINACIHFNADSSLKGVIEFDTSHLHSSGFIVYEPDGQDTFNIQFKYLDSTAKDIQILSYSTLNRFGTDITGITMFKSGDTTFITCKHFLPEVLKIHLPGSLIFHILVKLNDGRTVRRMISMIIKDKNTELTGIKELHGDEKLSIYPNPTSEFIQLNMEGEYLIINCTGQKVSEGFTFGKIILSNLKSGLYILRFKTEKGVQFIRFIYQ